MKVKNQDKGFSLLNACAGQYDRICREDDS